MKYKHIIQIHDNYYEIENSISVSREITLENGEMMSSQAFYLPKLKVVPVEIGSFVGDIKKGGSCNVKIISFCPHNLTHLETPNHILDEGSTLLDFNPDDFQGLTYLVDISDWSKDIKSIEITDLEKDLNDLSSKYEFLAIKTHYSLIEVDNDFSGTDPVYISPETARFISKKFPHLRALILDLPSIDREEDGGKLLAHRNFMDLTNLKEKNNTNKFIIELAYFKNLSTGMYYLYCTPSRIEVDAMITDVVMCKLQIFDSNI